MNLDDTIFTPWPLMSDRVQAYWNDRCVCNHTRLDHEPTLRVRTGPCVRCPKHRRWLRRRSACPQFRLAVLGREVAA